MNYVYFVSYQAFVAESKIGDGNCEAICAGTLTNIKDIKELEKRIAEQNSVGRLIISRVLINSFQLLRTED